MGKKKKNNNLKKNVFNYANRSAMLLNVQQHTACSAVCASMFK